MEWTNEQSERERINESEQEWGEICVQTFERVKWATVVYCVIFFLLYVDVLMETQIEYRLTFNLQKAKGTTVNLQQHC